MKTCIVAVSGGVDSVVLLDMLAKKGEHELVVAHFDHGIRLESDADARFVEGLAQQYGLPSEIRREELGPAVSEELARARRYAFLRQVAATHNANIATAHHLDDVVESIAINVTRGTGWRGLAVMGDRTIERPIIHMTKAEIRAYALQQHLEWVEDETNSTGDYLRNRLRRTIYYKKLDPGAKSELFDRRNTQLAVRDEIDALLPACTTHSRYQLTMMPSEVADEVLRYMTKGLVVQARRQALLLAIKTARAGTTLTVGSGVVARFEKRDVIVETPQEMI